MVRLGWMGCGGIAGAHLKVLRTLNEVDFVAFQDVVKYRAESYANEYGANFYVDHREMLDREDLDAVFITIPPFAHTDQELLCAEKGINFFVEKPVALTLEKAKEINEAVEKEKIITQVGYVMRWSNPFIEMRETLHEAGGKIGLFEAFRYGRIAGGPQHWWRRKELSGGQLVEQSTHLVDLARWYCGEVERVYAIFDYDLLKDVPMFDIEDVSIVTMNFRNGALGVLTSTCAAKEGFSGFLVVAENLMIKAVDGYTITKEVPGQKPEKLTFERKVVPMLEEDKHFLECVAKGVQTRVPYSEGLRSLEVTIAAARSAEEGRPITLPL